MLSRFSSHLSSLASFLVFRKRMPHISVLINIPSLHHFRGLEGEIAALIASKDITARIDSHNKILYARTTEQRSTTYRNVLKAGEEHLRATKALLLRASMLRFNLVQRPAVSAVPDRQEGPAGGRPGRHRDRKGTRGEGSGKGDMASFGALAGRHAGNFADDMMKLG